MRIAFLISGLQEGGAERVVTVLANEMYRQGHDVYIMVTWTNRCVYPLEMNIPIIPLFEFFPTEESYRNNKYYHLKKKLKKKCLQIKRFEKDHLSQRIENWKELVRYSDKAKVLAKYLKRLKIDVLYSFMDESNIIAGLCQRFTTTRIIISQRNIKVLNSELINYSYANATIIVFQTEEQKELFSPKIQKKGVVISNPIKEDLPEPFHGRRKKIIVNYCRLTDQKNIPLLINAYKRISQENNDYCLEIYGDGDKKDVLKCLIEKLELNDKARIYSFDSNIHRKIVDYSMFVMTSDYEGMPNSLLEAMALGMPVISTDCLGGGARAVIEDGVNGQLVPCNDEDALYIAMKRYIDKPDFAEKCGNNASKIRSDLSVERITDKWLSLVER